MAVVAPNAKIWISFYSLAREEFKYLCFISVLLLFRSQRAFVYASSKFAFIYRFYASTASFSIPPFYTLGQTYISTESPIHAENNGGGPMSVNCSIRKLSPYN